MPRFETGLQATLSDQTALSGAGVHSNRPSAITLHPAEPNSGIIFLCANRKTGRDTEIRADHNRVSATAMCTVLGDAEGASVATIEHLMATLRAFGVDNVVVEIDGPELPILDGSASDFVRAIDDVGIRVQNARRRCIKILKPIRVEDGQAFGELRPYDGMRFEVEIEFDSPHIGRQRYASDMDADTFRREIARARTFGFVKDVERLYAAGFALGASLENTVVIGEDHRILNPEGLRWTDEFVRHKTLDAIGDLALAGAPVLGCFRSYRGGHALNFATVQALFDNPDAWTYVDGAIRRDSGHADLSVGLGTPAFGPDVS